MPDTLDLPTTEDLRTRKRIKARDALERAALERFESRGFENTTVREIAHAADLSSRTFFRYFGSKEAVVFARSSDDLAMLLVRLRDRPRRERGFTALARALPGFADDIEGARHRVMRIDRLVRETPSLQKTSLEVQGQWTAEVARSLAGRAGRAEPSAEDQLAASIGIACVSVAVMQWSRGSRSRLRTQMHAVLRMLTGQVRAAGLSAVRGRGSGR